MNATVSSSSLEKPKKNLKYRLEAALLLLLTLAAVWLWSAPWRQERMLQAASFQKLLRLTKTEKNNPRVFYWLGIRLQNLGEPAPAAAAFARSAELDPTNEEAMLAWGNAATLLDQSQTAYSAYKKCVQIHPGALRPRMALALFCFMHDALGEADRQMQTAVKIAPRDADAWRLKGIIELHLQYFPQAYLALNRAVHLSPKNWRAWLAFSQLQAAQHNMASALQAAVKANALASKNAQTALNLGSLQLAQAHSQTDYQTAAATLQTADSEGAAAAGGQLGMAEIALGNYQQAQSLLQNAAASDPDNPAFPFALARVYRHLHHPRQAEQQMRLHAVLQNYQEQLLELGAQTRAGNWSSGLALARLYAGHGQYSAARAELRSLVAHSPLAARAQKQLELLQKQHPPALVSQPVITADLPISPPQIPVLLQDASTMYRQNRLPEAASAYLHILSEYPANAQANEGLGEVLLQQNQTMNAFKAFQRALQTEPGNKKTQYLLAHIYYQEGFLDEAARRIKLLLQKSPNNPLYLHALVACDIEDPEDYAANEKMMQKCASLQPHDYAVQRDLARCEVKMYHTAAARKSFRQALALNPEDRDTIVEFCSFLLSQEPTPAHQKEVVKLYTGLLKQNPGNADAFLGLGKVALLRHQNKRAVRYLMASVSANPNLAQAWFQLSRAYLITGDQTRSADCRRFFHTLTHFRTELSNTEEQARMNLRNPRLRLRLARLYAKSGNYLRAINQYQVCLSLDHNAPGVQKELKALTEHLKAVHQMPSESTIDTMILASTAIK